MWYERYGIRQMSKVFGKHPEGSVENWEPRNPENSWTHSVETGIVPNGGCSQQHRSGIANSCPSKFFQSDPLNNTNNYNPNLYFHSAPKETSSLNSNQISPNLYSQTSDNPHILNSNSPIVHKRYYNSRQRKRTRLYWQNRKNLKSEIIDSIVLNDSLDPRPYAHVLVNGVEYKGLLDSGATVSVLGAGAESFLTDPKVKFHSSPSFINTANGQSERVFGYICAAVKFNNKCHTMRLHIVPGLEQSLYLGIDFWNLFRVTPTLCSLKPAGTANSDVAEYHTLSPGNQYKLDKVIEKFPSFYKLGLGKTSLLSHLIDVGTVRPIKQRFYAVSPAVQSQLFDELDRMLSLGVIEESQSSWCSPVTLVRKTSGKVRLCLDARELNKVTVKDAYPLPLIDGLLGRLDQTRYISCIDLKDAFWQIPLDQQSRDKTAFTVPGRPLYQFTVMPFGLCNAPQTMCRLMHKVIPHQLHDRIFVYLDDLLVTSASFEEHLNLLEEVACRLKSAGLTINVEKSKFLLKEAKYLGYIIGDGCLRTDPDKVRAIVDFPTPKTSKQIRRFLGMSGWYRRFIQNYATLSAPLTDMLKKGSKVKWTTSAESAFESLKSALSTSPVLANPDYSKPFYIQCDASTIGVGSVLFQLDAEGAERPIVFVSQKLNAAQRNYSVTELECYAAVLSVKKFRPYVEGYPFTIYTDHASLQWLMSQKDLSGRLARWSLKLQSFDFQMAYRKGSQNVVPDALSRAFCEQITAGVSSHGKEKVTACPKLDLLSLGSAGSKVDNEPLHIDLTSPAFLETGYTDLIKSVEMVPNSKNNLRVEDGKLLIAPDYGLRYQDTDVPIWKLVVPNSLVPSLIKQAHLPPSAAHMGIAKTLEILQRQFYWARMAHDVNVFIKNCNICKMNKALNYSTKPKMGNQSESNRLFQKLYIDFLDPYPRSKKGNSYILIVLDHYSKFVLLKALREASAALLCQYIENEVFNVFSVPEVVVTDNGKQFISKLFHELLQKYGVSHTRTPIYSPQSNASERVNRTILSAVRSYISDSHTEWDLHLSEISGTLRNVIPSSTTLSPHFLVFGQHMILHGSDYKLRRLLGEADNNHLYVATKPDRLNAVREKVLHYLKVAYQKGAQRYNLRSRHKIFNPGQAVFVRTFPQSDALNKFSAKLSPKFVPAVIDVRIGNVAYKIKDLQGKSIGIYHGKDIRS